jgi:SAM-dependent methyltransferase/uncharacterized protein YbaR (Trm112 family)
MRYSILDDLVDPLTGGFLCVENAEVILRQGMEGQRCAVWCGRLCRLAHEVNARECRACQDDWIVSGELVPAHDPTVRYPVKGGIPRLLPPAAVEEDSRAAVSARTQESFGYEWEHFNHMLPEYDDVARAYFRLVPRDTLAGAVVLDAGCGMGRWARYVGEQGVHRLYALDFSRAIESAAVTLVGQDETHCIQADLRYLPFRPETFDFIYSLGVLHHLDDPDAGMRSLVGRLKPDGSLLIYLYYALDNRPLFHRLLLRVVTLVRLGTSCLSKPLMHWLSRLIGVTVYWPLARLSRLLERRGAESAARQIPLAFYRNHSLRLMIADAFDRFATPIEKRYSRRQIRDWLARYGFETTFSDEEPYWIALAKRPASDGDRSE